MRIVYLGAGYTDDRYYSYFYRLTLDGGKINVILKTNSKITIELSSQEELEKAKTKPYKHTL